MCGCACVVSHAADGVVFEVAVAVDRWAMGRGGRASCVCGTTQVLTSQAWWPGVKRWLAPVLRYPWQPPSLYYTVTSSRFLTPAQTVFREMTVFFFFFFYCLTSFNLSEDDVIVGNVKKEKKKKKKRSRKDYDDKW